MKISTNEEPGKIFIGGLTRTTTKEMLENEFSKYGDIIDAIIMKNNETGLPRGFGFVTYKDPQSANMAIHSNNKIDGKTVDVKLCNQKQAAQQRLEKQKNENCKIFIGGLPHGVTDDEIKLFFQRYGPVREFKMMYDDVKQRPRGFGFITFELEESANQVLLEHFISFKGKQIEVKPQLHNAKQQQQQQQNPVAQFSWNPTTASIEPTWSTLNNVVATAAANAYGNTGAAVSQASSQPWLNTPQDSLSQQANWAGYNYGQTAPNPMLNYYGQTQGYYQTDNPTPVDAIQQNDYDNNYSQHNYLNTNLQQQQQQQNQYYNVTNSKSNNNYSIESTTSLNNTQQNYQQSSNNNNNSHYRHNKDNNSNISSSNNNSNNQRQQHKQQQQHHSHSHHHQNSYSNSSHNNNNRQYHPYKR